MSRFVRQSQVRNLAVTHCAFEDGFADLSVGDVAGAGNLVSASARFVGFVSSHNGSSALGVVPVAQPGKWADHAFDSCQQGTILDVAFSPHEPHVVATGAGNGTVAVWRVGEHDSDARKLELDATRVLDNGSRERVVAVRWNPSASGIVAAFHGSTVSVWDAEGDAALTVSLPGGVMDGCWNPTGRFLACLNADKSLLLADPRQQEQDGVAAKVDVAHHASRPMGRIISGGATAQGELEHYLYSTGFGMSRDRELAVWDVRKLGDGCLSRVKVGGGNSLLMPVMVPDVKVLFLVAKGETSIRAFEGTTSKPFVHSINHTTTSSEPFLGAAALPVSACDVMGCEVSRLLKLTSKGVEAIRVEIPRRIKSTFHDEIFPDTASVTRAALAGQEWLDDKDAEAKQPMEPVLEQTRTIQSLGRLPAAKDQDGDGDEDAAEEQERVVDQDGAEERDGADADAEEGQEGDKVQVFEESEVDKRMSKLMGYIPKFKYARGSQRKQSETLFNLRVGTAPTLAVGEKRFAMSWQGGGGPVHVGSLALEDMGKVAAPELVPVLNGHSKAVFALDFSPFSDAILASGADDCHIRIWDLDDGDVAQSSSVVLKGHLSSVRQVKFHPSVEGVLASGSHDCTVQLWDVRQERNLGSWKCGAEVITDVAWNYNGSTLAAMDRGNALALYDPRQDGAAPIGQVDKAHAGAKPCFVTWLGDTPHLLTSGCARLGWREFAIWDRRSLGEPVSTTKISTGATSFQPLYVEDNGVVILTGRGENTFYVYELQDLTRASVKPDHSAEDPLKPHKCNAFSASGEPNTACALAPRRSCNTEIAEWAQVYRLTPTTLDPISFTVPRAADLQDFFADDIFTDTRSATAALSSVDTWLSGTDADPVLESMNTSRTKRLSQRDPALAHQTLKRAQENTRKFQQERAEEEERARKQEAAFERMRFLAVQHEAYNPNLSTGGHGHDQAKKLGVDAADVDEQEAAAAQDQDVADDEWDD